MSKKNNKKLQKVCKSVNINLMPHQSDVLKALAVNNFTTKAFKDNKKYSRKAKHHTNFSDDVFFISFRKSGML